MLSAAILAGGLATRLGRLTKSIPKSLLSVAGEPFLFHQLRLLKKGGLEKIVICTGHLGDQIQEAAGNGSRFGLPLLYSHDGPTLLGTGGALKKAVSLLGPFFFVMYGDSYLMADLKAIENAFHLCGKSALMTVFKNNQLYDRSNVIFEDGLVKIYDKNNPLPSMKHIDYGLGILSSEILTSRVENVFDLAEVYRNLSKSGDLAGMEISERFYEIGSADGLKELDLLLDRKKPVL